MSGTARRHSSRLHPASLLVFAVLTAMTFPLFAAPASAQFIDPLASNNTIYPPPDQWEHGFRVANYAYPKNPVAPTWKPGAGMGALTTENAHQYMN
ncbi:MAG: hypothetical protein HKN20_11240, partial [Gemmatimonadetes bacterium]|nr:hypothetical protein [Gemmatimonadota bacterium]